MPAEPICLVRELGRSFDGRDVLAGIDFSLGAGERLALRGPNGSGKSTLLRCVVGTVAPSSGEVLVGGHPAWSLGARGLTGAALSQERSFYMRLTGRVNLELFAGFRGLRRGEARRAVAGVVEELELEEIAATRADRCSTGMLQQLGFARALLTDPALLLLDEPTRSLDSEAVDRLWGAIDRRRGSAVLIATHSDEDERRCGERLVLG